MGGGFLQATQDVVQSRGGSATHLALLDLQDGGPDGVRQPLQLVQSSVQTIHHPQLHVVQRQDQRVPQVSHHLGRGQRSGLQAEPSQEKNVHTEKGREYEAQPPRWTG